jgi:hypothetical protein
LSSIDLARIYMWVAGAGLLLEGGALLLLDRPGLDLPIATGDARHNALHVVWGIGILFALATSRQTSRTTLVALVFGVFYTALAVLGITIDRPFGLLLGPGENVFHWIVGPLALMLGILSARRQSALSNQ